MNVQRAYEAFEELEAWCRERNFSGYDPYDALNAALPFSRLGKWPSLIAIQSMKRLPVNLRSLLGIGKKKNAKAIGLFLHGYTLMYSARGNAEYAEQAHALFNWLMQNHSQPGNGTGWGYPFEWVSSVKRLPAYSPTSVVTGFVARGVATYQRVFQSEKAAEALVSMAGFIEAEIPRRETDEGLVLSYSTAGQDCCLNASLLAAEILAYGFAHSGKAEWAAMARSAVDFAIAHQDNDGKWPYSINLASGRRREQIDFHQGYVLESIYNINAVIHSNNTGWGTAIEKGLDFYYQNQVSPNGRSYYRIPRRWPTDVHHQAQAIITFSRFAYLNAQLPQSALQSTEWALDNLRRSDGAYAYRKYKLFTDSTAYMRWGEAWMFLALATSINRMR